MKNKNARLNPGFTIVELLIVIVIIGILASITIVSYVGISKKATEASLSSDLAGAKKQLSLYQVEHESFPDHLDSNNCPQDSSNNTDTKYCLKSSLGSSFMYKTESPSVYLLKSSKGDSRYMATNNIAPSRACPVGFILVPGSSTYNTTDFCTMKYEAKNDGSGNPIGTASGLPWVSISQTDAMTNSSKVADCINCHLISEAEWMTLAQNVLGVASNWSGGSVGSGYVYSGHNDNAPASNQVASEDDGDGYFGTGQSAPSSQRRTLTLSNGEVIWDMAGNVNEWSSGQIASGQPGVVGYSTYAYWDWNMLNIQGSLAVNPTPTNAMTAASAWTTAQGLGRINSNASETVLHGFHRGGSRYGSTGVGVFYLSMDELPSDVSSSVGFRVSAPIQ